MRLQYQLSNGAWVDCKHPGESDRTEEFLNYCISNKQRVNREWVSMTREQVIDALESGATLRNDPADWYSNCRDADAVERIMAERRANRSPVEMVKCSCGHTVPRGSVMSASLGSSCPECYDRMSD